MAKKKKMNTGRVALLVIIVVIIALVIYQKGGVSPDEAGDEAAGGEEQQATESGASSQASTPVGKEAQPLYPDLCYAAGGMPKPASKGCSAGEENIGDVPGFKTPYVCCVKQ